MQVGLEQYPEQWRAYHEQQLAETLSKMRGRPFDPAPVVNTIHVFNWAAREVADLICFAASDAAGYITGASLDINGGDLMM